MNDCKDCERFMAALEPFILNAPPIPRETPYDYQLGVWVDVGQWRFAKEALELMRPTDGGR